MENTVNEVRIGGEYGGAEWQQYGECFLVVHTLFSTRFFVGGCRTFPSMIACVGTCVPAEQVSVSGEEEKDYRF